MPIFLSYSRKDQDVVKALAAGLEGAHREVWLDRAIGGGDAWWNEILEHIQLATVFVFAMSDYSLQAKPCLAELKYAQELKRPIVPILVGPVTGFPANPLADVHTVSFDPNDAGTGFAVLAAIDENAKLARPLPDPLPDPPSIPYGYLLALGRQIDSSELEQAQQSSALDQLDQALGEESEPSVRAAIVAILRKLMSKPWAAQRTVRRARFLIQTANPEQDGEAQEEDGEAVKDRELAEPDGEETGQAKDREQAEPDLDEQPAKATPSQDVETSTPGIVDADSPTGSEEGLAGPGQNQNKTPAPNTDESAGGWTRSTPKVTEPPAWRPTTRLPPPPRPSWQSPPSRGPASAPSPVPLQAPAPQPAQSPVQQQPPWQRMPSPVPASAPSPVPPQAPAPRPAQPPVQQPPQAVAHQQPPATGRRPPAPVTPQQRRPSAYWVLSVAALVLSVVFGIPALYFSAQVNRRFDEGDLAGAQRASRSALGWGITGVVLGVIVLIIYVSGA